MKFLKMHGLGNDFVILDQRSGKKALSPERIRHITDRHFGVGCDQLIVMEPSQKGDVFMRIYNSDGSEAEACGNATRCIAHLFMKEKGTEKCTVETVAGLLPCRAIGDQVEVDMGKPLDVDELDLRGGGVADPVYVNMGNPHCVFFVEDAEDIVLETVGRQYENHPHFPNRTNVEFAHLDENGALRLRVWERGAGVTLACGSGACATMVAAAHRNITGRKAKIVMDGGALQMEWRESDNHVLMTGPVAYVFEGDLHV
jgi:diaminopimelate epimerase